jgi:hypothetical protein
MKLGKDNYEIDIGDKEIIKHIITKKSYMKFNPN